MEQLEETREALRKMIGLVEEGHWTRDTTDDGHNHHCTYGLMLRVSNVDSSNYNRLQQALNETVPAGPFPASGTVRNGGTSRGNDRICSYNNMISGPEEIIKWYERALERVS